MKIAADRQDGFVMAMALMFLALVAATAAIGPRLAGLELIRASAADAWSRADAAAAAGLAVAVAVESGSLASTAPGTVAAGALSGADYTVRREFLGHVSPTGGPPTDLLEWHFLLSSVGSADRGARAIHARHVFVLAPAPVDPDACEDPGCPVPGICAEAAGCETGLYAAPVTVAWHLPEDAP